MSNTFISSGKFYDLLYKDKDSLEEAKYINQLLKNNKINGKLILEFGCGTGRHATLLAKMGYKVVGIDKNISMLQKAQERTCKGFSCQIGNITNININMKFDAVVSLFHVMSYLTTTMELKEAFYSANRHLKKDGLFIFDCWYLPAVLQQRPQNRTKIVSDGHFLIKRKAEPKLIFNENKVDVNYTYEVQDKTKKKIDIFTELHSMRYLSIQEIEDLANLSGFQLVQNEEWLTKKELSDSTWGACFVLKKIKEYKD